MPNITLLKTYYDVIWQCGNSGGVAYFLTAASPVECLKFCSEVIDCFSVSWFADSDNRLLIPSSSEKRRVSKRP
jgi:hypothetical protein